MTADRQSALRDAGDRALRTLSSVPRFDGLAARAARLYPDSHYLQEEWRRAVAVVRSTSRGWLLDRPAVRQERRHA